MRKRGFTLIELIVVMAIIAVLVLFGVPKYKEYSQQARLTKLTVEAKELEKASQKYYMSKGDWPRLSGTPYTAEQLESYAKDIYGYTGKQINLEESGKYYDIDYNKLKNYITEPKHSEKYIIQNPVGNVYVLDNLTELGKTVIVPKGAPQAVITLPSIIFEGVAITFDASESVVNGNIVKTEWQLDDGEIVIGTLSTALSLGEHTVKLRVTDNVGMVSSWVSKTFMAIEKPQPINFTSGQGIEWVAPATGRYKLEVWGAIGGGGGAATGGYARGEKYLEEGEILYVYINYGGGVGGSASSPGTYGSTGGGAADIRTVNGTWNNSSSLQSRIIVAGGGGGKGGSNFGVVRPGGAGGGTGTGNGILGQGSKGENGAKTAYITESGGGGGGGGYYGGLGGSAYGAGNGGGYGGKGGTSYVGGVENGFMQAGVNSGAAKASITYMGSN